MVKIVKLLIVVTVATIALATLPLSEASVQNAPVPTPVHLPIRADDHTYPTKAAKPNMASKGANVDCSLATPQNPEAKQEDQNVADPLLPLEIDESVDEELDRLHDKLLRSCSSGAAKSPRVLLLYNDERVRDRFCANARRLLDAVLEDPRASSKSALIAHKALRYRKITHRLEEVDPRDPGFDASEFFGVEWRRKDTRVNAE
ncbi:uncharacterized protein IUM83_07964 [Phytophthora cinnamomi]|uniref:uncharacterized protein n=1 Tax=Phytophthora cinnamomi TaxID=4785 RepID=UPI003559F425|nr:hypothetical protein IUM83_07964 [Phytophthora cinnamomi]